MTETRPIEIELNPRERRLYDRMRERVLAARPRTERSGVGDLLLLLPDLTALLARLLRDPRVRVGDKALAVLGLGYALSPVDLLPALLIGPVGLVDDLLVVTAALARIVNHVHPDVVRGHWSGQGDALQAIQRVTNWSERLVVGRVRGVVRALLP